MERFLFGLVAGLLGGAGGSLAVHLLLPRGDAPVALEADAGLAQRLDRIERALAPERGAGPTLSARPEDTLTARLERIEGLLASARAPVAGPSTAASLADPSLADPATVAALRRAVGEELEARLGALKEAATKEKPAEPKKKRTTLAEAAKEVDLSTAEEAELRKIYADHQEKTLKLVAGPDGDVEGVRRDLEEAKRDPKKRSTVMMKYMPRLMPKLGEFMTLEIEKQTAIQTAVGPDKAGRLESGFNLVEDNPLGGDEDFQIEARASSR